MPSVVGPVEDEFDHEPSFLGPRVTELCILDDRIRCLSEKQTQGHRLVVGEEDVAPGHPSSVSACYKVRTKRARRMPVRERPAPARAAPISRR